VERRVTHRDVEQGAERDGRAGCAVPGVHRKRRNRSAATFEAAGGGTISGDRRASAALYKQVSYHGLERAQHMDIVRCRSSLGAGWLQK
jgi:hypothetical protein